MGFIFSSSGAGGGGSALQDFKESVRVASIADIDLSVAADPSPVDAVTLADGDRILLKNQIAGAENGIYVAVTAIDPTSWVRAADFDSSSEVTAGTVIPVAEGASNGDKVYLLSTNDPIVLDTTPLAFVPIGSSTAPGGANTQIQFNNSGDFGGDADLSWDKNGKVLTVAGISRVGAGSAGSPSLSFSGSPNVGLYNSATNQIDFSTASTQRWKITATGRLQNTNASLLYSSTATDLAATGNQGTWTGILQDLHVSRGSHSDAARTTLHIVGHLGDLTAGGSPNGMTASPSVMDMDIILEGSQGSKGIDYFASENSGFGYTASSGHIGARFRVIVNSSVASRQHIGVDGFIESGSGTSDKIIGLRGLARNATNSIGLQGLAALQDRASSNYIGVLGIAENNGASASAIAGFFTLNSSQSFPAATKAGLIVNNHTVAADIAKFQDNGTDVLRVLDGGAIGTNQTSAATTPGSVVAKMPIYDAAGALVGYIPVYDTIT